MTFDDANIGGEQWDFSISGLPDDRTVHIDQSATTGSAWLGTNNECPIYSGYARNARL